MATKIRLQRHGRKKRAFYHIVVADSRAPRDGRFIEKIGTYNPITNPATIELDVNKATQWLLNGAEPTDTARAILSYKGAAYKKHLQVGVNKGAISQEEADKKFAAWMDEKDAKVSAKKNGLADAASQKKAAAMKAETQRKDNIAAKIEAKNTVVEEVVVEAVAEEIAIEAVAEVVAVEAVAEAVAIEAVAEEVAIEAVAEEVAVEAAPEEVVVETASEEVAVEATETPAEESASEETAAE
jgi:small subunit ribosomal protein S16